MQGKPSSGIVIYSTISMGAFKLVRTLMFLRPLTLFRMLKRLSIEMKFKFQTQVEQKSFESRFAKSFFGANVFQKIIKHVEHNFDFNDLLLFLSEQKRKEKKSSIFYSNRILFF